MLSWPSHDYTFFANAAVGQRLKKLKFGADVTRQLEGSNVYWSAGYDYEFTERAMHRNLNKQHARLSAGYYISPDWSARVFAVMRRANGIDSNMVSPANRDEAWYLSLIHICPMIAANRYANMTWQIGRPFVDRGPIPDRDPATSPLLLDLSAQYNRSPEGVQVPFYSTRPQLRPYPVGVLRIGGVDFDVRGVMDIGREVDQNLPGARFVDTPRLQATAVHALLQPVLRKPIGSVTAVAGLTWRRLLYNSRWV